MIMVPIIMFMMWFHLAINFILHHLHYKELVLHHIFYPLSTSHHVGSRIGYGAKRAGLNDDPISNAKTSQFSDMIVKELKGACRQRDLQVGGRKSELLERLKNYVLEQVTTMATAGSPDEDELDMDITDEDLVMMP